MTSSGKKPLIISVGVIAVIAVIGLAAVLFVDLSSYKPRIEAAASEALDLDFRIKGRIGLSIIPGVGVSLNDVSLKNGAVDIASAEKISVTVELLPLIKKEIRIARFNIARPKIRIVSDKNGRFNFERPVKKEAKKAAEGGAPSLGISDFRLTDGEFVYSDMTSGSKTEAKGISAEVSRLSFGDTGRGPLGSLTFRASISCSEVKSKPVSVKDIKLQAAARDGVVTIDPMKAGFFGGVEKGAVTVDLSGAAPDIHARYSAVQFPVETFLASLSQKPSIMGKADFSIDLKLRGKSGADMKKSASGVIVLKGENLTIKGTDIDKLLAKLEETQNLSLMDAGAFLIAGPFGPMLTKGAEFTSAYKEGAGGEGHIRRLYSKWTISKGIANAEDVALSTKGHRLAVKGRLELPTERIDDVTVAALNARGCATLSQKIGGTFSEPKIEKVSAIKTVAGSILRLFSKTKETVSGEDCQVFYSGTVQHPVP